MSAPGDCSVVEDSAVLPSYGSFRAVLRLRRPTPPGRRELPPRVRATEGRRCGSGGGKPGFHTSGESRSERETAIVLNRADERRRGRVGRDPQALRLR
jgi:hypothetical protein